MAISPSDIFFLKGILDSLGILRAIQHQLAQEINANPDKLRELMPAPYTWASVYELSFLEHLSALTSAAGLSTTYQDAIKSEDPASFMFGLLNESESSEYLGPDDRKYDTSDLVGLQYALGRSLDCFMAYEWYLNELIAKARNGDDKALFKALGADRAVVACPTVAHRFALAEIQGDSDFLSKAAKAIASGLNEKNTQYMDLRYLLPLLEKQNVLEGLSQEDAYHLFVKELRVYPDSDDGGKSLHQFLYRWRRRRHST
jgi:hypothetical protein